MTAPFIWSPSRDRRIRLFDYAGRAPRGLLPVALPLRWPDTPIGVTADFSIDASALQVSSTDALTLAVNAVSAGLVLQATFVLGGLAVLWLATTAAGDATVDLTLTTQSTSRAHRIARLQVY